ncbi:MAG: hypothetical protein ABR616_03875 [Dermatophilaceae bacterium]|nr:hypothetical protein [Intrasporangiaceae bacterium]
MITSTTRKIAAAAAAAVTGLTLGAAPATAGVSSSGESELALFYFDDEYALFTGPPFDEGCRGEGFQRVTSHVVETPSGIYNEHASGENLALLYDLEAEGVSSGFELLEKACAALEAGETMPEPVAEGTTSDRRQAWEGIDKFHYRDTAVGTLKTPDGQTLKVHGRYRISVTFAEDGTPHVDEFASLNVHAVG